VHKHQKKRKQKELYIFIYIASVIKVTDREHFGMPSTRLQ